MARIDINDMRFYANHGCFVEEQKIGTRFSVDLSFETDTTKAEVSDNIADTVSYLDVFRVVKQQMEIPSHLLECVAHRIAENVLTSFPPIDSVAVCVRKLNPPLGGDIMNVSVSLRLSRTELLK